MKQVISDQDRKFVLDRPSPGFSPARTASIIEGIIKDYDAEVERRNKLFLENAGERIDMATSFLVKKSQGSEMSVEQYLGKSNLKRAWGEAFTEKLKIASALYRKTKKVQKILL